MDARSRLLVLALGLCLWGSTPGAPPHCAAAAEPDVRYVQADRASVYAGPSQDYYPTSILNSGDAVEVIQQTDDGWLAIRPPSGSFSWIPATQGFLLPGGRVVEVTDTEAVSWIGSSLGTAKQYRWQVRLRRGEQLTIIGEQTLTDEKTGKKTLWYKIAPPNGEFRWIEAEAVSPPSLNAQGSSAVAAKRPTRNGSPAEVTTADGTSDEGLQSILQASGEEPIDGDFGDTYVDEAHAGKVAHESHPGGAPAGVDRWNTWHAIEFKNGSFSFPGIARMLGMEPPPSGGSGNSYDPFDLAAGPTTPRRSPVSADAAGGLAPSHAPDVASESDIVHLSGPRKPRGWRDPRQLRDMRERDSSGEPTDSSLASSGYGEAVGSGVIAASATTPGSGFAQSAGDADWYGIVQAPQATSNHQPLQLQHADLSELQLLLSEMVAGPEHTWNLAPLADRARYLIEHGATAIERGEARLLLDRIEAFADVARRSTQLGMTPPVALPAAVNASISESPVAAAATRWASPLGLSSAVTDASSGVAPRFDATGWVVPVHSTNPDMPTHALTNDAGRIIVYLTPAAGVNLARYQSQAVGVYGLRGYLPQLKANHIQVQRAVRLH